MRLTLRTLLAWLDGVLPDEEQRQLGTKVSGSAVAAHLVERIRSAVARTNVGAPKPEAKGLADDPNSVAAYLDNALASEQLEAFERICIESEVHLAEVAACHALLAEVARDHGVEHQLHRDERERIQQRLLGLLAGVRDRALTDLKADEAGANQAVDGHDDSRATARAIRTVLEKTAPNGNAARGKAAGDTGRRPAPWAAWLSAGLALALVVALAGVLTFSLSRGGKRQVAKLDETRPDDRRPDERQEEPAQPAAADDPAAAPAPVEPPAAAAGAPAAAAILAAPEKPAVPEPVDPLVAEGGPPMAAAPPPPAVAAAREEPQPVLPAAASPAPAPAPAVTAAAPPAGDENDAGFVGGEGVLLRMAGDPAKVDKVEWSYLPAGGPLQKREDLLALPGAPVDLHVRGVHIRLLPETRAVLTVDADGTPRLEVVFGRSVARSSRGDARLGITAAGLMGRVDAGLLEPVAVEVELDWPPGADPANAPARLRAVVGASSRGLAWRQTDATGRPAESPLSGIDAEGMLEAGSCLVWTSDSPMRASVARNGPRQALLESGARVERAEKTAGESLAARVAATPPPSRALREMAADRRVENRMLAAASLALIGEFDDLVEQLAAESPGRRLEAKQWATLEGRTVRLALSRGGNAAARLYESFGRHGPHGKTDLLWALACGLSDEELAAGADRVLVEALEDPSLFVRRYAYKALCEIVKPSATDQIRFRPDGLAELRRDGAAWWRAQLEKGRIRRGATPVSVDRAAPAERAAAGDEVDADEEPAEER